MKTMHYSRTTLEFLFQNLDPLGFSGDTCGTRFLHVLFFAPWLLLFLVVLIIVFVMCILENVIRYIIKGEA